MFSLTGFDASQMINGIIPITDKEINCHHPDLLTSCNLLHPAAIEGKKVSIEKNALMKSIPSGSFLKILTSMK